MCLSVGGYIHTAVISVCVIKASNPHTTCVWHCKRRACYRKLHTRKQNSKKDKSTLSSSVHVIDPPGHLTTCRQTHAFSDISNQHTLIIWACARVRVTGSDWREEGLTLNYTRGNFVKIVFSVLIMLMHQIHLKKINHLICRSSL